MPLDVGQTTTAPSTVIETRQYSLPQYGTPRVPVRRTTPNAPTQQQAQTTIFGEPIDLSPDAPIGFSFADIPLGQAPYQDERQYTLPQFGDPTIHGPANIPNGPTPGSFGLDGTLTQQQLTEAARLTSIAMFGSVFNQQMAQQIMDAGIDPFPIKISTDLANELPYNARSPQLQAAFMDAFGVPGFETASDMLEAMNYIEYEPGKWWRLDKMQQPFVTSGTSDYNYGYGRAGRYTSQPRAYSYGGGGLVTWRIGL